MILFLLLLTLTAHSSAPLYWNHSSELRDRHEFYANGELLEKPKDSWQLLFSVVYTDIDLKKLKDCVFFRVPGVEAGVLKTKTIPLEDHCESYILGTGDQVIQDIQSLKFSTKPHRLTLYMTFPKYKQEKWNIKLASKFQRPEPRLHLSSADFQSPKIIWLAPKKTVKDSFSVSLKEHDPCHQVTDDCQEISPSVCSQCEGGWYEIPNGCPEGPKFCGYQNCGVKNGPACRRGMKWQKKENQVFDCRQDSSFAYCSGDAKVVCEGKLAYCR